MKDYEVNMYCYLRMITTLELLSFAMVYVEFSGFLSVDSMLKSFFSTKIMELRNGVGLRWVGGGGVILGLGLLLLAPPGMIGLLRKNCN